jgi:hypothetical protein
MALHGHELCQRRGTASLPKAWGPAHTRSPPVARLGGAHFSGHQPWACRQLP